MGNFNKFDKGRGGRGGFGGGHFDGGRRFGGHNDGPMQMHPATCSQCGQSCEVPFKPTGERPIFCNSCFKGQGGPSPRFTPPSLSGEHRGNTNVNAGGVVSKAQIDSLNAKLDKILAILTATKAEEAAPKVKVATKKAKTPAKKSKK